MRHGWKTRIEERRYFEEKKLERERNRILMAMAMAELREKIMEEEIYIAEHSRETH